MESGSGAPSELGGAASGKPPLHSERSVLTRGRVWGAFGARYPRPWGSPHGAEGSLPAKSWVVLRG